MKKIKKSQVVSGNLSSIEPANITGANITQFDKVHGSLAKSTGTVVEDVKWGSISGNINNQTDLITKFDTKQNTLVAGTNITIEGNVISATAGEPVIYIKDANATNTTLTLTKKDGSQVIFTPQTGAPNEYLKRATVNNNTLTLVNKDDTTVTFTPQGGGEGRIKDVLVNDESVVDSEGVANIDAVSQERTIAGIDLKNNITSNQLGSALNASDIVYTNPTYTTIGAALDKLLYVSPSITSFLGGGTYEIGTSISSINFTWTINKNIATQLITPDVGQLASNLRAYTYTPITPITADKTFTLSVNDGTTTATRSTALLFKYKGYFGELDRNTITSQEILALGDQQLMSSRVCSKVFNCTGGKYFYIVLPTIWCTNISFKVGGLAFSDMNVETRTITNASGYSASYNIYRPNNIQTGSSINVEVN